MRHITADTLNAMRSPSMNGPDMRVGKNVLPVIVSTWSRGSLSSTLGPPSALGSPSSCSIGL